MSVLVPRLLPLAIVLSGVIGFDLKLPSECGRVRGQTAALTLNGDKAAPGAFPWHAAIYLKSTDKQYDYICGGSLVSASVIVTAAHCFYQNGEQLPPEKFKVALGKIYSGWNDEEGGKVHRSDVDRIVPHPLYQGVRRKFANDVAIVELQKPVNLSSNNIAPICMNHDIQIAEGEQIIVVGWGSERSSPLEELASVNMKFKAFSACVDAITHSAHETSFVTADKFCSSRDAGVSQPAGLAKGDSGGGAVVKRNGRWHVVGLVSVALDDGKLYVFTDMRKQSPWLKETPTTAPAGLGHGLRWVPVSRSTELPTDAIKAGFQKIDDRDNPHYVGRVYYKNAIVPATVTRYGEFQAYAAWEGAAHSTKVFEVAVADELNVRWVPATSGSVPPGAAVGGIAPDGETLYICRTFDNKPSPKNANHFLMLTPGVLRPSNRACSVEFYGARDYPTYEVLVLI